MICKEFLSIIFCFDTLRQAGKGAGPGPGTSLLVVTLVGRGGA